MRFATLCGAVLIGVLVMLGSAPAAAQALSLSAARELARAQSTELAHAQTRLASVALQVDRAWARMLPRLEAQGGFVLNDREIRIALPAIPGLEADTPVLQQRSFVQGRATLETQLLDPGFFSALRGARTLEEAGEYQLAAVSEVVDLAVVELFYRILAADALQDVADAAVVVRTQNVAEVEQRWRVETATALEVSRARTELLEAELDVEEIALGRRELARALAELVGLETVGELVRPPAPEPTALTDGDAAVEARAEVRAARLTVEAAWAGLRSARADYWPRLVASAEYRIATAAAVDGEHDAWQVGVALSWLIFDRGLLRLRADEAELEWTRARTTLDAAERSARRELRYGLDALETAARRVELAERRVALAEEAAAQAEVAYTAEAVTNLEVLEAHTTLVAAQNARVRAVFEHEIAVWRLRRLLGRLE